MGDGVRGIVFSYNDNVIDNALEYRSNPVAAK